MVTINLLFVITVLAAALALYDGIVRVRGKGGASILAIAEIAFAVLMLISLFVAFPAPLTLLTWAILLEITLIVILVLRGSARGRSGVWIVTIIALVLNTIVVLVTLGWLSIPGLF